MCGIAAIITGIHISRSDFFSEFNDALLSQDKKEYEAVHLSIDELKAALQRRGPDNLAGRKLLVKLCEIAAEDIGDDKINPSTSVGKSFKYDFSFVLESTRRQDAVVDGMKSSVYLDFIGATLQLRGSSPIHQPLVDASGNLLVYNGEIFGGVQVNEDSNDSEVLLHVLERCCTSGCHELQLNGSCSAEHGKSVPEILSSIKGPWAFIYWQEKSNTIWFGRDAFGRRSLLVHYPTPADSRFLLSSVSPPSLVAMCSGSSSVVEQLDSEMVSEETNSAHDIYWEELPCGIYSIQLKSRGANELKVKEVLFGEVIKHEWKAPMLSKIISWDRLLVDPKLDYGTSLEKRNLQLSPIVLEGTCHNVVTAGHTAPANKVLSALQNSVMRQSRINSLFQTAVRGKRDEEVSPVAVLFSGGLDSMILAALLDRCVGPNNIIDLLNVSFDGQLAPDRVSARSGLKELQRVAPLRRWRLVEIDATLSDLTKETKHVMSLIHPANTYMDLNIGMALWLAAGGDGWVDGKICNLQEGQSHRYMYKSEAVVLFVGSGADEQCAGYGRHRTKYKNGGWHALHEEMRLDVHRIWKRNLGRDDRLISDHGKEARFPFLDEEVIQTLLEIPLWDIATLDEPVGKGDKKILREVARLLGLQEAAVMPKRAIQFGSRIARESNRKNFGSNRAANQASAGGVKIHGHVH